jgi:hypothetical protein
MKAFSWILAATLLTTTATADTSTPSAQTILEHVLESDPFGLSGAQIVAHATLIDKSGSTSGLSFSAKSKRLGPGVSESIVRFSSPPEYAGAAFLQVQKTDGDDDRFLFLPDLKRSRRISGDLRSSAFMGTDLSFADIDRRDLRDAAATLKGSETIDRWDCYVVDVVPRSADSPYSRGEFWVRKDNFVPLRMKFYDRSNNLLKTFAALEVRRVSGQWFISKSRMTNTQQNHSTDLVLEQISTTATFNPDEFTVRALERSR